MRPIFNADLVNGVFGDPGVYLDLKFMSRALLFDIGDISALPTRKLLRISDVFISHTHMDHFAGFDHLLRVCLGRDAGVRVLGPPPIIDQVEHKLHAYTWNLVENYANDFTIDVREYVSGECLRRACFRSRQRFRRETLPDISISQGVVLDEPEFKVRACALDHHGLPSLSFAFEEGAHLNVWRNRLQDLGLPTGPWLTDLKQKIRADASDDVSVSVRWRQRDGTRERCFTLGELRHVVEQVPGEKVCYVTDVAYHTANLMLLRQFLAGVDLLFIESVFLHEDSEHAARKAHLTAIQAGSIAREVKARAAVPFHFSTRYYQSQREGHLRSEFERAWCGQAHASQLELTQLRH